MIVSNRISPRRSFARNWLLKRSEAAKVPRKKKKNQRQLRIFFCISKSWIQTLATSDTAENKTKQDRPNKKILISNRPLTKNSLAKDAPRINEPSRVATISTLSSFEVVSCISNRFSIGFNLSLRASITVNSISLQR